MDAKSYKDLSIREFTRAARIYDSGHAGIYEMCKNDYPPILEELEKQNFTDLLDVGCGTGPMVELLSEHWPERHYTGLDLTPEMIARAQAKGLANAEFVVGDAEDLPFAEASFDAVICANSFHHYPDPQAFFDGAARVLRPGGRLVLRDYTAAPWLLWLMNHTEMPLANLVGHGDVRAYSLDEVRAFCTLAGLRVDTLEKRPGFRLHLVAVKPEESSRPLARAEYDNWVPKAMVYGFLAGAGALGAAAAGLGLFGKSKASKSLAALTGVGALGCGAWGGWCAYAHGQFSYDGDRQLSRQIVEGTAGYVTLPEGGVGLDVGCGSGALTIAAARRNPQGRMVGVDRWGPEYYMFSKALCERNARAEGVGERTEFRKGDAVHLPFADETFDAVTSNYVYHNITGRDKQQLLLETLRVLKKGGTFAIHDLMSPARYGDMEAFCERLRSMGYEHVELIDTAHGRFMGPMEAKLLLLGGSTLLYGRK